MIDKDGPWFGEDLLDKQVLVEEFGQQGNESIFSAIEYLKKRACISEEYAKSLQKLKKSFLSTAKDPFLEELLLQAEQTSQIYLALFEALQNKIVSKLKSLAREHEKQRKEALTEIKELRNDWKKATNVFEKHKKNRDSAVKAAEEAKASFLRADVDKNVTKAFVEKSFEDYSIKSQKAGSLREEYIRAFEEIRPIQDSLFRAKLPVAFNKLQSVELFRLEEMHTIIKECGKLLVDASDRDAENTKSINGVINAIKPVDTINRFISQHRSKEAFQLPIQLDVEGERTGAMSFLRELEAYKLAVDNKTNFPSRTSSFDSKSNIIESYMNSETGIKTEQSKLEKELEALKVLSDLYKRQPNLADASTKQQIADQVTTLEKNLKNLELCRANLVRPLEGKKSVKSAAVCWDEDAVEPNKLIEALYDYNGRPGTDELNFKVAERFILIKKNEYWWEVERISSGEHGYVPYNYVKQVE